MICSKALRSPATTRRTRAASSSCVGAASARAGIMVVSFHHEAGFHGRVQGACVRMAAGILDTLRQSDFRYCARSAICCAVRPERRAWCCRSAPRPPASAAEPSWKYGACCHSAPERRVRYMLGRRARGVARRLGLGHRVGRRMQRRVGVGEAAAAVAARALARALEHAACRARPPRRRSCPPAAPARCERELVGLQRRQLAADQVLPCRW